MKLILANNVNYSSVSNKLSYKTKESKKLEKK